MKKYLIVIIASILFSCSSRKSNDQEHPGTPIKKQQNELAFSDIQGVWFNEKYIQSLVQAKTAKESQSVAELSFIEIKLKQDSTCLWVWELNEGTPDKFNKLSSNTLYFDNGSKIIFNTDSIAEVKYDNKTERLVKYSVAIKDGDKAPGELIASILFSNRYRFSDPSISDKTISFHPDGALFGFLGYGRFEIICNYYDMGLDDDLIYLYKSDGKSNRFIWQFDHDTLKLFEANCTRFASFDGACEEIQKGNIVYKLLKD